MFNGSREIQLYRLVPLSPKAARIDADRGGAVRSVSMPTGPGDWRDLDAQSAVDAVHLDTFRLLSERRYSA
jgi:hypothetical protein